MIKIIYNKIELGKIESVSVPVELWNNLIGDNFLTPKAHKTILDSIESNIKTGNEVLYSEDEINIGSL
jgi:hypothetical protein